MGNCGNLSLRCQGRSPRGDHHEASVPMRSTGADQPVRVMKAGNAAGAKGLGQERVRELVVPIRWPRTLQLVLKGCDGESNAFYENAVVTVCYEFLDDIWRAANSPRRPAAILREDAVAGPVLDVFLHESGHALFDLLKIPLLGREEDAADQMAAYYVLQLPKEVRRRLILGAAHSYASELKVRSA